MIVLSTKTKKKNEIEIRLTIVFKLKKKPQVLTLMAFPQLSFGIIDLEKIVIYSSLNIFLA